VNTLFLSLLSCELSKAQRLITKLLKNKPVLSPNIVLRLALWLSIGVFLFVSILEWTSNSDFTFVYCGREEGLQMIGLLRLALLTECANVKF
jgi:hypothetical protein